MAAEISLTNRLARNSIFGLMAWFLPIIIGIFTTPILVRGLGTETFGLYAVITGFISYSFSFGIGKIAAKYVAEYRATGETQKINPVVSATLLCSLAVALLGTMVLAVGARTIAEDVLLLDGAAAEIAVTSLYLACGISAAAMFSQVFQFVLQGVQRFGSYLILTNVSGILLGAGNIVIVLSGGTVIALLVWNLLTVAFVGLLFFVAARKYLPELRLTRNIDREAIRSVAGYGVSIIFYQVFANVLFIFERSFVMRKFGAEALAYYSVPMMLAIYLHAFVGSFAVVLFPVVNELLGDRTRQIELYKKATKIILAIVVFVVTTFIATGRAGLAVWINDAFAVNSYSLLVIHSLTFGMMAILVIVWQIAEGFRHAKINAVITAIWLIISVPLMILTANTYLGQGVAASRLVAVLITMPVIFYTEKRFLGMIFWRFWTAIVFRVIAAAGSAGLAQAAITSFFSPGWGMLAFAGLLGLAIYAGVLHMIGYLTAAERALLSGLVVGRMSASSKS